MLVKTTKHVSLVRNLVQVLNIVWEKLYASVQLSLQNNLQKFQRSIEIV